MFSGTLGMIVLHTWIIFTFYRSSCFNLLANKAFLFKSFFINILYTFNVYYAIFFFKIALWYPNSTYIMYPNKITDWLVRCISWFCKIIVIGLRFPTTIYYWLFCILFFLFDKRAGFRILMIPRVSLSK